MMRHLLCIALLIAARPGVAGDVAVKYRLMGLFQPDRAEDLRKQAGTLAIDEGGAKTLVKLVDIDFEAATATFSYDADAKAFQGKSPQQVHESINNHLHNASRHNFNAFPRIRRSLKSSCESASPSPGSTARGAPMELIGRSRRSMGSIARW